MAARSFVQGLGVASDVVRKVAQVRTATQGSQKALQTPTLCPRDFLFPLLNSVSLNLLASL